MVFCKRQPRSSVASVFPPHPLGDAVIRSQVLTRLATTPGVERLTAKVLLAEVGTDMQWVSSVPQLVSWVGFKPSQHESADHAQSARTRKGTKALRTALVEAGRARRRLASAQPSTISPDAATSAFNVRQ